MVKSITSLGHSGLKDWMIQRSTAIVLAAYVIYLAVFLFVTPDLEFQVWQALFAQTWFKIFSFLAIAALCFHAWAGLWIITTDYLKSVGLRLTAQLVVIVSCFAILLWGAHILWSL